MIGVTFAILATTFGSPPTPVEVNDVFAKCLVRHHLREVTIALDSGFDEKFASAVAAIPTKNCDEGGTPPAPAALRGPLYAAVYRKFGPQAGRTASNIAAHWIPTLSAADPKFGWYVVSDCLVTKVPDATRQLVRAETGSDAANKQFAKVIEKLPACLPAGTEFKVNRPTLLGLIAETVYQIDFAVSSGERKWWP